MEKRKYYRQCDICGDRFEQSDASRDLSSETDWLCVECHIVQNLDYKALIDRLIKRSKADESGSSFATICSRNDLKLAASAITDLLSRAEELRKISIAYAEVREILGDNYNLTRLRELVEADREGRSLVSPCKIGQTVWFIRDPKQHPESIVETTVEKIIQKHGGMYMKLGCNSVYETSCKSIGKTVFLSYEEAKCLSRSEQND